MKKHLSKKRVVLAAIVTVALALASGVAYAYWTSGGTGDGTATAGTSVNFTVALEAPAPSNLLPGGSDQDIKVKVSNTASFAQTLSAVAVTIANTDGTAWTKTVGTSTCSKDDFSVSAQTVTKTSLLATTGSVVVTAAKIHMLDLPTVNQDACKNASVPLHFVAS